MKIDINFGVDELAEMDQTYAEMLDAGGEHLGAAIRVYREQGRNKAVVATLALLVLEHMKVDEVYLRAVAALALAEYAEAMNR